MGKAASSVVELFAASYISNLNADDCQGKSVTDSPSLAYPCPRVVVGRHRALDSLKQAAATAGFFLQALVGVDSRPHLKVLHCLPWKCSTSSRSDRWQVLYASAPYSIFNTTWLRGHASQRPHAKDPRMRQASHGNRFRKG